MSGTFNEFISQLVGLSTIVLNEAEATEFLAASDKILDQYKRILGENLTVAPTVEDISRYYVYYAAFTKRNAIESLVGWDTNDTYPITFDEYLEKATQGGWSFLRTSVGIPIPEWNIILPEPTYGYEDEAYDDEYSESF